MPQLNPDPWFLILVLSWSVLLFLLAPKLLARTFPSGPLLQNADEPNTTFWSWTWQ